MRKLLTSLLLLCSCVLAARAQTRTYSDNASNTFVFGLESYFFGSAGSLEFSVADTPVRVSLEDGAVSVDGQALESGPGDTVIGVHEFTGDQQPELVVARRTDAAVEARVYRLAGPAWELIGEMSAPEGREIRIFRQVVSIRGGDALHVWTWHKSRFDYKTSTPR